MIEEADSLEQRNLKVKPIRASEVWSGRTEREREDLTSIKGNPAPQSLM